MSRKSKISKEKKLEAVINILKCEESISAVSRRLGMDESSVKHWIIHYQAEGPEGLETKPTNRHYPPELKLKAVQAYLNGHDSELKICEKFHIRSKSQLQKWLKVYNNHECFKNHNSGGESIMSNARKTTIEERIEISKACLESDLNYGEVAKKYNVSYSQVYNWTKKYKELGKPGLEDRRGRRTKDQEPRTPEEEYAVKLANLEHENYLLKVENALLKKVKELERGNANTK